MKSYVNKSILITGGAGFIGSNLCENFLKKGYKVICLDNFSTGSKKNIKEFINQSNFKLIEGDIRNLETCKTACTNVDYVLHQAALGSVPRSIEDPITSNEVNINGFLNIVIASKENRIKRIVYAASSSTYGDSKKLPKVEDNIGNPLSPYAITKLVNELYADVFHKIYGINLIGLRYFNVFGKKQSPNGSYAAVIPKFIKKLIKLESPIINGDGSFSRDFTHIDNVISMNELALFTKNKNALNQVYNTAAAQRTTILELTKVLKKHLSKFNPEIENVIIKHGPERDGDVNHSLASISKAKKLLGYQPVSNFENGILESVDWYWNNLK